MVASLIFFVDVLNSVASLISIGADASNSWQDLSYNLKAASILTQRVHGYPLPTLNCRCATMSPLSSKVGDGAKESSSRIGAVMEKSLC